MLCKYGNTTKERREKIRNIIEDNYLLYFFKKDKYKNLFNDIKELLITKVETMPEEVYTFIFQVLKELYNNRVNKTNITYFQDVTNLLYEYSNGKPEFYESFKDTIKKT